MKKKLFFLAVFCMAVSMVVTVFGNDALLQSEIVSVSEESNTNNIEKTVFEQVNVKINGQSLNSFYAPVIMNGVTIVPLRDIMESLGWNVKWIEDTEEIVVTRDDREAILKIGSSVMTVNGNETPIPASPLIIGEISYVPVRAVAEALGALVGWESENSTAAIYTGEITSTLTIANYSVNVGSTTSELISVCGQPTYKVVGDQGLLWYVYAKYPAAFMAVATDGGIVCGYYTNSTLFSTSDGHYYGDSIPENEGEYKEIKGDNYKSELFYDKKDKILCAIKYMADGYSNHYDKSINLENQARMGLDILNSFRYAHGKNWLVWNQYAAESCVQHSYYMAKAGVLTHKGSDGSSAIERYLEFNPEAIWRAWGETICAEAQDIFTCINGWLNTDYHRSIMLSDKTDAGIGFVYLPDGKFKYCTTMLLIK